MSQIHSILTRIGFRSVSSTSRIVENAIHKAFDTFGESCSRALIYNLAQTHHLPENVILSRYDLVERSIKSLFGFGSEFILGKVRDNILQAAPDANEELNTRELIDSLQEKETLAFLRRLCAHQHVLFLYTAGRRKDVVLHAFFDSEVRGTKGVLHSGKLELVGDIKGEMYDRLLSLEDVPASMRRLSNWIDGLLTSNATDSTTRIAGEDDAWFLRNGFEKEILSLENSLGPSLQGNLSILCSYDTADLDPSHIETLIASHSHVVLDEPFVVYAKSGERKRI